MGKLIMGSHEGTEMRIARETDPAGRPCSAFCLRTSTYPRSLGFRVKGLGFRVLGFGSWEKRESKGGVRHAPKFF